MYLSLECREGERNRLIDENTTLRSLIAEHIRQCDENMEREEMHAECEELLLRMEAALKRPEA